MLRIYAADNLAIISVAHAVARHAQPNVTEFIREAVIKGSWETLLSEGKDLPLHDPTADELREFFETQGRLVDEHVADHSRREQMHAALAAAQQNTGDYLKPHVFYTWQHVADLAAYTLTRQSASRPLVIACDLDGCLYDFNGAMREWLITRGWDPARLVESTQYYLQREWGIDERVWVAEMTTALGHNELFRRGPALLDAVDAVRALGSAGHIIMPNSARLFAGLEENSRAATVQWLREQRVHPDRIHLADPKDPADKLVVPFDLLVDDHPGNVEYALAQGRSAVLLDRPWNAAYAGLPRATYAEIAADPWRFVTVS
jgi:hypothetical protein